MNQKEKSADKELLNASASKRKLNSSDLFPANHVDEKDKRLCKPVLLATKIVFRALAYKKLLPKCIHGQTQNPNESFNNCVWERIPKNTFVGINTLKIGVMDAVLCFNDGVQSRTEVFKNLGITPRKNTCDLFKKINKLRIKEAEFMLQEASNETRTLKRQIKRVSELSETSKQDEYGAGKF
ncbi:hypothetical protein AVEN_242308-1 [Araneus ventricosus]|uniref:Uncharacterized protein n=1 Tax=Araneus ventricosus TaxID=182803 RepID=A0A4Y2T0L7_ARAVE|nr:hypothetical protein AVEN_242308-1 [Araneus ventricosus]